MKTAYYAKLDGHKVVPVDSLMEIAPEFEKKDARLVSRTNIDKIMVSTVFLAINHSWGSGPDLWFETMIFGMPEEFCNRYTTWEEAEAGHVLAVRYAKGEITEEEALK